LIAVNAEIIKYLELEEKDNSVKVMGITANYSNFLGLGAIIVGFF
jgi:hypothetical protein